MAKPYFIPETTMRVTVNVSVLTLKQAYAKEKRIADPSTVRKYDLDQWASELFEKHVQSLLTEADKTPLSGGLSDLTSLSESKSNW